MSTEFMKIVSINPSIVNSLSSKKLNIRSGLISARPQHVVDASWMKAR